MSLQSAEAFQREVYTLASSFFYLLKKCLFEMH